MKKLSGIMLFILALLSLCSSAGAGGKVLLVHSYYSDYPWVNSITAGVKKGLEGSAAQLEIFYMDTKRKSDKEWFIEIGNLAKQKVEYFKPDVVIPADDNAQEYFAKDYIGKPGIQIAFCGVNEDPAKYGYPAGNATGVIQKSIFVESVELLLSIKKDIRTLALISDSSETSIAIISYFKTLKSPVQTVSFDQASTFDEWKAAISRYQTSADAIAVLLYQTIKNTPGAMSMNQKDVINWTMANNVKPTVGFFEDAMEDGVLCGIAESGEEQGFQAAHIAAQMLKGKKASEFPIVIPTKGIVIINMKTAEKLGVKVPFSVIQVADKVIE